MHRYWIILVISFLPLNAAAQEITIRYRIIDVVSLLHISGVKACTDADNDTVFSNTKGILEIQVPQDFEGLVFLSKPGYFTVSNMIKKSPPGQATLIKMQSFATVPDTTFSIKNRKNFVLEGKVINSNLKSQVKEATVRLKDGQSIAFTDWTGDFKAVIPGNTDSLVITSPGFQDRHMKVQRIMVAKMIPDGMNEKDIFHDSYKNTLSLSLLEFANGAVAFRYERFLLTYHSTGIHSTFYFFNHSEEGRSGGLYSGGGDSYVAYSEFDGIKIAPFYRYYLWRNLHLGGFLEAKPMVGYSSFPHLDYQPDISSEVPVTFWTFGFGLAFGMMIVPPGHIVSNLSIGYQYFPMNVNETPDMPPLDDDWWYKLGPGAYFELKFTVGGIF